MWPFFKSKIKPFKTFFFRKNFVIRPSEIFLGKGHWNQTLRNGSFREKIHNRYRPVFQFGSVSPQNWSFLTKTEPNRTVHIPSLYEIKQLFYGIHEYHDFHDCAVKINDIYEILWNNYYIYITLMVQQNFFEIYCNN